MKIRTASLVNGSNEILEDIAPSELELDSEIFSSPVSIRVKAEKGSGRIALSINTTANGGFICDRCGDDIVQNVIGEGSVIFVQRDEPFPDEEPGDDLRSYGPYQEYLDISTEVRDALFLAIPMKNLCKDDCKGFCSVCKANLNKEACRCNN